MAQILDQYGRPIRRETLQAQQTARLGHLHSEFALHPSRGLTPAKLARILEAAELGDPIAQCDLFLDMEEKDAHIYAEMSKRKRALLTVDWDIVPPRNADKAEEDDAAYVKELVLDIDNLEDMLLNMLDAIGHGFACEEIEWRRAGREWLPKCIEHRPQSWFQVNQGNWDELRLRDHSAEGEALEPFGWLVHVHRAKSGYVTRSGLHRVLAWPYLFKNYSVRDLAEFLEIYGLPLRLGKYPAGADDKEKATLLSAVVGIGHDAAGIIPESMSIEFKEAAKGEDDPFQTMIAWCEASQSKAILGGTLTSQTSSSGGGAYALGQVHNEVRHDLKVSDALQLSGTLTKQLVYPCLVLNKGMRDPRRAPRFRFDVRETEDFKTLADALPKLAQAGMPIPVSWARDKLRIPEAQEGEAVLSAPAAPESGPEDREAANRRVAAARLDPERDEFDDLADEPAADWERVSDPLIAPVLALAAECRSLEEFQRRLPELVASMDQGELAEALARGQLAAALWGRLNDGRER